jgi:DNA-binding transcriptional ArsR family regulator
MTHEAMAEIGPEQLKALTHPLRLKLLKELRVNGPATATLLGQRLEESSGATSYHLRQLGRHGFVEEDAGHPGARERWWRASSGGHTVDQDRLVDDPEHRAVFAVYASAVVSDDAQSVAQFVAEESSWSPEWVAAADLSSYRFRLTPARLRALVDRLHTELDFVDDSAGPGSEDVLVLLQAFPRRIRPFTEES